MEPLERRSTSESVPWRPGRALFPAAIAIANCAMFLFQIMVARITTPELFGQVMALLGLLLIIEAPASTAQAVLSRAVQRNTKLDQDGPAVDLGPIVAVALGTGVALCAALLLLMPAVSRFLHISRPPYLVAFYAIPVMLGVAPKGVLVGLGDLLGVSVGVVGSAVIRLVAGTALLHSGFGLSGAVAAVVIGETLAGLVLLVAAHRRTRPQGSRLDFAWRDAFGEGTAFTGLWILTAVDVVMSRHYLSADRAGAYAAGATLAQLVMIAPMAAAALLFPQLTGSRLRGPRAASRLTGGVVGVAAVSAVLAVPVELMNIDSLRTVFDQDYLGAAPVTGLLLASAACLGIVTVLLQFLLARHEAVPAAIPWLAIVAFITAAVVRHNSMGSLATEALASTAAAAVIMLAIAVHGCRYVSEPSGPHADLCDLQAEIDLTVVVPYYNPGDSLAPHIRRLLEVLDDSPVEYEVIAVSDGSTDGSDTTITELVGDRLRQVILPSNRGKGAALRVGLAAGRGRYLGFIDADGDLDPQLLEAFMTLVNLYRPDVVIGSKRHPLSDVHYPPLRWVYSIGFQYLVRIMFRLNVRDTQTGLKLIRRDILAASLPRMLEKRFAFDLELLVVAHRLGYRRFLEAPVMLQHQFRSTVSIRAVRNTLVDTLGIFYRLRVLRSYDRLPPTGEQEVLKLAPPFVRGGASLGR